MGHTIKSVTDRLWTGEEVSKYLCAGRLNKTNLRIEIIEAKQCKLTKNNHFQK